MKASCAKPIEPLLHAHEKLITPVSASPARLCILKSQNILSFKIQLSVPRVFASGQVDALPFVAPLTYSVCRRTGSTSSALITGKVLAIHNPVSSPSLGLIGVSILQVLEHPSHHTTRSSQLSLFSQSAFVVHDVPLEQANLFPSSHSSPKLLCIIPSPHSPTVH